MADQDARSPSTKRFHVVLIPGFAGFDALGQLEYYALVPALASPKSSAPLLRQFPHCGGGHARRTIAGLPCEAYGAR